MTIRFQLAPETEHLLEQKAARRGLPLEAYLREIVEREAIQPESTDHPLSQATAADSWVERWRVWAQGHPASVVVADDSRESIYDGRGE
jgi:plasmid stability protein